MGSHSPLLCWCGYSYVCLCSHSEKLTCPQMTAPLLTGVLRYLGCLLLGLNGHIVLLPAAALQTTRSSTHTCQAMSLAPWVLRHSRAPLLHTWLLNPCTPIQTHIHTPKSSHIWTNKHVVMQTSVKTQTWIHRDIHNWISHKHRACIHALSHTATHTHTQSLVFIGNTPQSPCLCKGYIQCVGRLQNSERVKFHICQGGEGKGTGGWFKCTRLHMETGFRSKLPVTRSSASISCRFSVFALRGELLGDTVSFPCM